MITVTHALCATLPARPSVFSGVPIGVCLGVGVALSTDRILRHSTPPSFLATHGIHRMGDWFEMVGVNTAARSAEVVEFETGWNWSNQPEVGDPMGEARIEVGGLEIPVASVGEMASPEPTSLGNLDAVPKVPLGRRLAPIWVAVLFPAQIVHLAHSLAQFLHSWADQTCAMLLRHRVPPVTCPGRATVAGYSHFTTVARSPYCKKPGLQAEVGNAIGR